MTALGREAILVRVNSAKSGPLLEVSGRFEELSQGEYISGELNQFKGRPSVNERIIVTQRMNKKALLVGGGYMLAGFCILGMVVFG